MHIYLIERTDRVGYDEYDSAVVVAQSEEQALELLKKKHPNDYTTYHCWGDFKSVIIRELSLTAPAIILESFNAG